MALVLSRKKFEAIRIGDVVVTVAKITGTRVTLAIQAPDGTPVLRAELDPMQDEFNPGPITEVIDATAEEVEDGPYPF